MLRGLRKSVASLNNSKFLLGVTEMGLDADLREEMSNWGTDK